MRNPVPRTREALLPYPPSLLPPRAPARHTRCLPSPPGLRWQAQELNKAIDAAQEEANRLREQVNDYEAQQAERAKSPLGVLGKIATGVHQSLLDAAENGRNGAAPMGCFSPRNAVVSSKSGSRSGSASAA